MLSKILILVKNRHVNSKSQLFNWNDFMMELAFHYVLGLLLQNSSMSGKIKFCNHARVKGYCSLEAPYELIETCK